LLLLLPREEMIRERGRGREVRVNGYRATPSSSIVAPSPASF